MRLMIAILGAALLGLTACGSVRRPVLCAAFAQWRPHWHLHRPGTIESVRGASLGAPPAAMLEANLRRRLRESGR
jgi:hypothetical protein